MYCGCELVKNPDYTQIPSNSQSAVLLRPQTAYAWPRPDSLGVDRLIATAPRCTMRVFRDDIALK